MVKFNAVLRRKSTLYCILLTLVIVGLTAGQTSRDDVWLLRNEAPCLSAGGLCVVASYCKEGYKANGTGLCPKQEPEGVCCHKIPEEASCIWHGGHCTRFGCSLPNKQRDCPEGTTCCILLT